MERFRLYVDESGDHVFRHTEDPSHRFLCLMGCWFRTDHYLVFQRALEDLKARHLPHHPDEPVVLHREDMVNARRVFKSFQDERKRAAFDSELLSVIGSADFLATAVIIDKLRLLDKYGETAAHPYHLALGFLLQRYTGYLNHIGRCGDVIAEARGGVEDRLLADSFDRVFQRGVWMTPARTFQAALTSSQLKLKHKGENIAGLQLSDLLGHPVKQWALIQEGLLQGNLAAFAQRLVTVIEPKLNRQLYRNRISGYGVVIYPKG